ncbi:MAG: hypothetical protein KAJ58_01395 [Candidatus Pacebacteria bacterium]|nr:hypothetical protein [Candidatus Paceibacterota bacterium]
MKNNIYKISYLFLLVILLSNSFSVSVMAQQELLLEKITDFNNITAGSKSYMELKMTNNTSDIMAGVLDVTVYQGDELFDGEGIVVKFLPDNTTNNWLVSSNWLNGSVIFNGFDIALGETFTSVEITTHSALVSGEYSFRFSLNGTNDSGEEYSAPVIFAGGGGILGGVSILGDINGDGRVDKYDLALLMSYWGQSVSGLTVDLNGDGVIDKYDFSLLLLNWS